MLDDDKLLPLLLLLLFVEAALSDIVVVHDAVSFSSHRIKFGVAESPDVVVSARRAPDGCSMSTLLLLLIT